MSGIDRAIVVSSLMIVVFAVLPVIASIILLARKKLDIKAFLLGVASFLVSQIILRIPILNVLTSVSPEFAAFSASLPGIILIGGFTAGLFEESARLGGGAILRNKLNVKTLLSFGLGHGLCEVVMLNGLTGLSMLTMAMLEKSGTLKAQLEAAGQTEMYMTALSSLSQLTYPIFAYGVMERISAVLMHIFMTALVMYGVKTKKYWFYALSIGVHMMFNSVAVLVSQTAGFLVTEIILLVIALVLTLFGTRRIYRAVRE